MMTLTAEAVEKLFSECVAPHGEPVEGIVMTINMDTSGRENEIASLLAELPEAFRHDRGGGWSFLNACFDRNGIQWTGLHCTMERLVMLGIASKQVQFTLPRHLWEVLPGGMPYFSIRIRQ